MEITKTETTIEIKLKSAMNVTAVYVDNLDNFKNAYSAVVTNHTQATVKEFGSVTQINIPFEEGTSTSAFTVTISTADGVQEVGFYYDKDQLYYAEIDVLTNHCNTCLDKQQKERMALFILKKDLLEYAEQNNMIDNAVNFYIDLDRMLNLSKLSRSVDTYNTVIRGCNKQCKCCCNGSCAI